MIESTVKVDYLRLSTSNEIMFHGVFEQTGTIERPMYGYESCTSIAYAGKECGLYMTGGQGQLLQMSGRQLDGISESISGSEILKMYSGLRATRIDIAIDVFIASPEKYLEKMYNDMQQGNVKTMAKTYGRYQSVTDNGQGTTVSVGSRKSERYMRAYNKGVEMGLPDANIIRFEMEVKGLPARNLHKDINRQGLEGTAKALFSDFVMFEGVYSDTLSELKEGHLTKDRPEKEDTFFDKVLKPYLTTRINVIDRGKIEWLKQYIKQVEGEN